MIASPETGVEYRVERLLGSGGFGEVYLSRRLGHASDVPDVVCIKVSARIDGWLREAYFGQLLDGHPRAIQVFDTFPIARSNGLFLYGLVLEARRLRDCPTAERSPRRDGADAERADGSERVPRRRRAEVAGA